MRPHLFLIAVLSMWGAGRWMGGSGGYIPIVQQQTADPSIPAPPGYTNFKIGAGMEAVPVGSDTYWYTLSVSSADGGQWSWVANNSIPSLYGITSMDAVSGWTQMKSGKVGVISLQDGHSYTITETWNHGSGSPGSNMLKISVATAQAMKVSVTTQVKARK